MVNLHWLSISIYPSNFDLTIEEFQLSNGKLFQDVGGKKTEVPVSSLGRIKIPAGKSYSIFTSGADNTKDGTAGSFELVDGRSELIGVYYWKCLESSIRNVSAWEPYRREPSERLYTAELTGGIPDSDALGHVSLQITKIKP